MMVNRPNWLVKPFNQNVLNEMGQLLKELNLNTVCEGAACPNIGECFSRKTATFMVLGSQCSRRCTFCAVGKEKLLPPDPLEPNRVAEATNRLGLKHVVVTSVTRDDLIDGGALHFKNTIESIRKVNPKTAVEILTPDFKGATEDIDTVLQANPDIFGHNIETVPSLYQKVRPNASYTRSLDVLNYIKRKSPKIYTKSGLMVGLGETFEEVIDVIKNLKGVGCDILTIGQYLSPSKNHLPVVEYIEPEVYSQYENKAKEIGFKYIVSGPFVRSSYLADSVGIYKEG